MHKAPHPEPYEPLNLTNDSRDRIRIRIDRHITQFVRPIGLLEWA